MEVAALAPDPHLLAAAVAFDLLLGDPVYGAHPVRLMGGTLGWFENRLRRAGFDGYAGGIALFVLLAVVWCGGMAALLLAAARVHAWLAAALHIFLVYSLLAMHDLLRHAWNVERAARRGDVTEARTAVAQLVGRDTDRMDLAACRRATIESLSENLTDGYISPLFWYAVGGAPGLVLFKVASTMDSMVGYKSDRYIRFGWCGARLDDLLNLLPARFTWLLLAALAFFLPGASAGKALRTGWKQHAILPGPNSGWSEATIAGALQRRLIGPVWANGALVTEVWLGDPDDPPAGADGDLPRAMWLTGIAGVVAAAMTVCAIAWCGR